MNKYSLCLFVVLLKVISVASNCGIFTVGTRTYDLAELTRPTNSPYSGKEARTNFEYWWNFCNNLVGVPSQVSQTGPATVIQVDNAVNGAHATGRISTQTITEIVGGIQFTYKNNIDDYCRDANGIQNILRTSIISIACDPEAKDYIFLNITEPNPWDPPNYRCKYLIYIKHRAACPVGITTTSTTTGPISTTTTGGGGACGIFKGISGSTYDLAPLTRATTSPFQGTEWGTTDIYYWNFCTNLVGIPSQVVQTGPTAVLYLDSRINEAHAIGRLNSQDIAEISGGIQIVYKNSIDDFCRDANGVQNLQRTTFITILCDPKATYGNIINITEPIPNDPTGRCKYYILMKHSAACAIF